jgi:hypothetical protein
MPSLIVGLRRTFYGDPPQFVNKAELERAEWLWQRRPHPISEADDRYALVCPG